MNSSFVGGLGGARKAASFVRHLHRRGVEFRVITDSRSVEKLLLVGITPGLVVGATDGMTREDLYKSVQDTLSGVAYDAMVSFGWRTYVPFDAVQRHKPVVLIDGGWPRQLEEWPSPFCHEVYRRATAYCITNWFYAEELNELLPADSEIRFLWIAQPLDREEIGWHRAMAYSRKSILRELPYHEPGYRSLFLDMNAEYVQAQQGQFTGGWLSPVQVDECRGFVSRLLAELEQSRERLALIVHEQILREFETIARNCLNLKVIAVPSLSPKDHHLWRAGADLVLHRATRCVGATQTALSLIPSMKIICPATDDYMGERSTCEIGEDLGLCDSLNHQTNSLREGIERYLGSRRPKFTAERAGEAAESFWRQRGPDYLLDIIGMKSASRV